MSTLQEKIAQKFLDELAKSGDLKPEQIEQLKVLLGDRTKKLKADDFLKIFNPSPQGDLQ